MIFIYSAICSYKNLLLKVSSNYEFQLIDNKLKLVGLTLLDILLTLIVSYIISIVFKLNIYFIFSLLIIFGIIFQSYLCSQKIKNITKNEIRRIVPNFKLRINNKEII